MAWPGVWGCPAGVSGWSGPYPRPEGAGGGIDGPNLRFFRLARRALASFSGEDFGMAEERAGAAFLRGILTL